MARPLRIEVAGGWYHVTARGNERRAIYRDDQDRRHFLELIGEAAQRFGLAVHAYVLMDNHYHLLVETREANLSRAMQWLGVSYTVWFNRRHRRVGHLFQGRFKAVALEQNAGAEVSRYLHMNPVRVGALRLGKAAREQAVAGMGQAPDAKLVAERLKRLRSYRWSSYGAYVGLEQAPQWLACEPVLAMVGGSARERNQWRRRYRAFVEEAVREGLGESPWERVEGQVLLGGAEFVKRMRALLKGNEKEQPGLRGLRQWHWIEEVIGVVEGLKREKWAAFRDRYGDWGRDVVLYFGRKRCGLKLRELAEWAGGLDEATVGLAVQRLEKKAAGDWTLARIVKRVEAKLKNEGM
jgi:REP element-mobilizing transposase RayT